MSQVKRGEHKRAQKKPKGFTLVELTVAMSVSLMVLGAVFSLFILAKRGYSSQEAMADLQQNLRASLEMMGRQFTNLQWVEALDCTPGESSITFYAVEETGTASGADADRLSDHSKSWNTDQFKNAKVIILDGSGSESADGTSTGNNDAPHLNDTLRSWQVNEWRDYDVVITGGAAFGQIRAIASNTATQLTIAPDWTTIPDETSHYQIRQIRTIRSNTSTRLTVSPDWADVPDDTSLYVILRTRGFSRDPLNDELDYRVGNGKQPFSEQVVSLTLQGFDELDAATCDPADMRRLGAALTGRTPERDPMNKRHRYYRVKTSVVVN